MTAGDAYAALDGAVRAVCEAEGYLEEGEFVGDFVVAVEVQRLTDRETSPYVLIPGSGSLPTHRIVGLLRLALADREG